MYVSLNWLKTLININQLTLPNLCNRLTLAGFEIDSITKKKLLNTNDYSLDISITANRGDMFSVYGIAKEIRLLFQTEQTQIISSFNLWHYFIQKNYFITCSSQSFSKNQFSGCSFFALLDGTTTKPLVSTKWVQKRLLTANIFPTNSIIDLTNIVLLETGYLFTVYDKRKLQNIVKNEELFFTVQWSRPQVSFDNVNSEKTNLTEKNLLVLVNKIPIKVVGLNQIYSSLPEQSTKEIIIECSLFNPIQIRKSTNSLGFRTESSQRLEKDLTLVGLERALTRLIYLFSSQGVKCNPEFQTSLVHLNLHSSYKNKFYIQQQNKIIKLKYKSVNQILGEINNTSEITKKTIFTSIINLNFKILKKAPSNCYILIPFSRYNDINQEIDLLEEIGRKIGFNKFISILPLSNFPGKFSQLEKLKRRFRGYLLNIGLNELFQYTLCTKHINFQPTLQNPILSESNALRSTLLDGLLNRLQFNSFSRKSVLEGFEIGRTYSYNFKKDIIEKEILSGIFGGQTYKSDWNTLGKHLNWFEAKGLFEEIFYKLNLKIYWVLDKSNLSRVFDPGKLGHLFIEKTYIGLFGQIHPILAKRKNLTNKIFLFELNLEIIEQFWQPQKLFSYNFYSIYPSSSVDLSIILSKQISFKRIQNFIYGLNQPLLKKIYLFDFYSDSPIPKGYQSFGFKLKFQSQNRTLTNYEIDKEIQFIKQKLKKEFILIFRY